MTGQYMATFDVAKVSGGHGRKQDPSPQRVFVTTHTCLCPAVYLEQGVKGAPGAHTMQLLQTVPQLQQLKLTLLEQQEKAAVWEQRPRAGKILPPSLSLSYPLVVGTIPLPPIPATGC